MTDYCLDKSVLILLIIVIIIMMIMICGYYSLQKEFVYIPYNPNNPNNLNENITDDIPKQPIKNPLTVVQSEQIPKIISEQVDIQQNVINRQPPVFPPPPDAPAPPFDIVKSYDYRKLYDPLQDPRQRPDRYLLGPIPFNPLFNVPTQGYADSYRWMGLLIHTHDKNRNDRCNHGCPGNRGRIINHENKHNDNDSIDPNNRIIKFFGRQKNPGSNQYQYYATISSGNDIIKIFLNYNRELYDDDIIYISELNGHYRVQLNRNDDVAYNPYVMY
ncbi:MAG: hypothetical protein Edafosvirus30_4 [Edafosvirus sp.]|uniref:Uncharacterized protein n=1 Tax=Edafosvirus sp. TaxID=2487765 RepID=A0A3G4ZYU4_9VIRU|nr:MAG: hypothetical protein Edafosvirus30_4 [Edafosvirus sp.]